MRWMVAVGLVLLLGGCAHTTTGRPHPVAGASQSGAPEKAGDLRDRIAWVRQGTPVDLTGFHSARIDGGPVTDLREDIAFVSPTRKISCITGTALEMDGFDCMVSLTDPVPAPGEGYGQWFGGYVSYSGQRLTVGRFRGDPGLFINGEGATLPYDSTVTFGEYLCRLATTGLTCVNPTTGSGVQLSSEGVVPLGCLRELPDAERESVVGRAYAC
ncbi:hypothetical protein ACFZC5_31580 [Nocardia gamkensis]|uniref:hypothetical protein n=1 Tax=Nocardia gamkensis TaxID=352869 RepID=UPI0036ED9009